MATIPRYTREPFPTSQMGVGGGTPATAVALDPRGLVPVDRAQPLATDGLEPQRLMERRLGTMPPSSFSGAGAYSPVATGMSQPTQQSLGSMGAPASLSGQAMQQLRMANTLPAPGAQGNVSNPRALQALQEARARATRKGTGANFGIRAAMERARARRAAAAAPADRAAVVQQELARQPAGLLGRR